MEDLLERYVNERSAEREIQADLRLVYRMVDRKKVTLAEAAEETEISVDAFAAAMKAYKAFQKI